MKVQTRLYLTNTLIFSIIFITMMLIIVGLYYHNSKQSTYNILKKTSYLTALFYLKEDEMNKAEFAKIKKQFEEEASNQFYQFYNDKNIVEFGIKTPAIKDDIINKIRSVGNLAFEDNGFYCYGIYYEDNQGNFVVVAKEKTDILFQKIQSLIIIVCIALLISILLAFILSRWIAKKAYEPFSKTIRQVNNITTENLNVQIESPQTKDELDDLINTFNNLLSRISETFVIQQNFVKYVSHEFKTPLAAMLGNLEVFSLKDRSPEEYQQVSNKLIIQIHQLEDILNTLMIISDLRVITDANTSFRIDELTWQIIEKISKSYPNSKILVNINITPNKVHLLSINADSTQILIALYNIIENAVKYSIGKTVDISISEDEGKLSVTITDKGIGIPLEQLKDISKPFYRANNTNIIQGSGIGLSIALRILEKNDINYQITSKLNQGTKVTLIF